MDWQRIHLENTEDEDYIKTIYKELFRLIKYPKNLKIRAVWISHDTDSTNNTEKRFKNINGN